MLIVITETCCLTLFYCYFLFAKFLRKLPELLTKLARISAEPVAQMEQKIQQATGYMRKAVPKAAENVPSPCPLEPNAATSIHDVTCALQSEENSFWKP